MVFCAKNGMWGKWGKGVEKFPNIVWNILGNRGVACHHTDGFHALY